MEKLSCGIVVSDHFISYIEKKVSEEHELNSGRIFVIEYQRCSEGNLSGKSWWSEYWAKEKMIKAEDIYRIGKVKVAFQKQTLKLLKDRYIDMKAGKINVN